LRAITFGTDKQRLEKVMQKRLFALLKGIFLLFPALLAAQSPTDGLMMPKRNWCTLLQYSHSAWDEYWEGSLKRSNQNLGTVSTQSLMLMSNYGISDRLNVLVGLPYIWTDASASYLDGQSGLQDLSLWLKYQAWQHVFSAGHSLKFQVTGGLSAPVSDYVPDFLPLSIGLRARTASLRGIAHFSLRNGLYATAQGGHSWRSNIRVDRDAFLFHNSLIYSNEVPVPNLLDASARIGFLNKTIQAELWCEYFGGLSGDDIRYNDAPFPSNKMQAASAGIFAKYYWRKLALSLSASRVLQGRNVGQSSTYNAGFFYFFTL
jgi:hypothetical protein